MSAQIQIGRVTASTVELRGTVTVRVSWAELREAAEQEDADLRAAYGVALVHATRIREGQIREEIESARHLVVMYGQDETHVWWVTWVETESGLPVGRTWRTMSLYGRAEGGTLPQPWLAASEAEDIAARIRRIAAGSSDPDVVAQFHCAARVVLARS